MLVVQPIGGLSNMLRVVFSYVKLCRRDNQKLIVIWKNSNDCPGLFLDYFEPIHGVTFIENNSENLNITYTGFDPHPEFNPYFMFIYSELKLTKKMAEIVSNKVLQLDNDFIAIQVRRTDHVKYALKCHNFTTDDEFCKFIESNPKGNLFITSDNEESYNYFKSKYSNRVKIGYPANDSKKKRHTSLKDAIIDMFVCVHARIIKTSGASSFGYTIQQLRNR